jgi:6-phosphogluconolactonase
VTESRLVLVANAGDGSISTFRFADGRLERLAVTDELTGCSTFAIDSDRDLVYAAVKGTPAEIVTLSLDRTSGRLTTVARRSLADGGMTYLSLTRGGTALLGASYGGGYGVSLPVTDGVIGDAVSRVEFPNLHCVVPSDDGGFAYFVSLGADLVAQYALADDLTLDALTPETVAVPAGSGPRHLVLNGAGSAAYVMTEFSGEVLRFERDPGSGVLTFREAVSVIDPDRGLGVSELGADPKAGHLIWGADLHLGAGDAQLWTSERTESTLGAATISADGAVSAPERFFSTEPQPRGFALSPDAAFLIATGERSSTVSLYAVDGDRLELVQQAETGAGANWVRFV